MPNRFAMLVASEGVSADTFSGRLTLYSVIEQIFAAQFPALIQKFFVTAGYWLNESPETIEERVVLVASNGTTVVESRAHIEFVARAPGQLPSIHYSLHALTNMVLPVPGDYEIQVTQRPPGAEEWQAVGTSRIVVLQQPHPLLEANGPAAVASGSPPPSR